MGSIEDVADQINARLDLVATNTGNTAQNTADIRDQLIQTNNRLAQIDATLAGGFANLSQGLFALIQVQIGALALLDHNRKQNDTIICELLNSNTLLCNIVRKLGHQLRLDEAALRSTTRIEGIAERVHSGEAADHDRNRELHQKMEQCCPPEPIPEEACPPVCPAPRFPDRPPPGLDWQPLPKPGRPNPIG